MIICQCHFSVAFKLGQPFRATWFPVLAQPVTRSVTFNSLPEPQFISDIKKTPTLQDTLRIK